MSNEPHDVLDVLDEEPELDLSPNDPLDTSYLNHINTASPVHVKNQPQVTKMSKADVFKQLNSTLSHNDFGIPDFIYRADLISNDLYDLPYVQRNDILEGAIIPISWEHGYPSTPFHTPIWEQLPAEPLDAYNAFIQYLELPQSSESNNPIRMLPLMAQALGVSIQDLSDYSHMYYWKVRFRAYDLFLIACHQKQREQRIMTIEGKHYTMADKLLGQVDTLVNKKLQHTLSQLNDPDSAEDAYADLKLKDLVDAIAKLTQIQRISVGLPANGNDSSNPNFGVGGRFQSSDDAVKEIAAHSTPQRKADTRSTQMNHLLANPDDLMAAQELIIRSNKG